jgi:hypothetical protein
MLSRHSEGASLGGGRVSMYPEIKAMRTQDKKGNSTLENIPNLATWLHPNFGRHPLDVGSGQGGKAVTSHPCDASFTGTVGEHCHKHRYGDGL